MNEMLTTRTESERLYEKISGLIISRKAAITQTVNTAMLFLYWEIGEVICTDLLTGTKADYGRRVVEEVSEKLKENYGRGFDKSSVFRMVKFYQEFPDRGKVATLSQQLTWSHFVELLPIEDGLKRDFYAAMCRKENWSVRTLRERKNSMLYERTAISRKPEETIKHEIEQLAKNDRMSLDLFYRDPYVLDFLGLKDTYSEKDLENAILSELGNFHLGNLPALIAV